MIKEQSKHKPAPKVSFERDIRPLFRDVDISHMKVHGIMLDDYAFMSEPDNANKVMGALSPHEDDPPPMPPGGPIGQRTSSRCSPSGRRTDTSRKPHPAYSSSRARASTLRMALKLRAFRSS